MKENNIFTKLYFFPFELGGRENLPNFFNQHYQPKLLVENKPTYLDVAFLGSETDNKGMLYGTAKLINKEINYDDLREGVNFFILEDQTIVGHGVVVRRY